MLDVEKVNDRDTYIEFVPCFFNRFLKSFGTEGQGICLTKRFAYGIRYPIC